MKIFMPILLIISLFSCKAQNNILLNHQQEFTSSAPCPDDAVCTVELIPNSSLKIMTDDYDHLYTAIEKGEHIIFKYSFKRNENQQYVDGHYFEEIYAELESDLSDLSLKDNELAEVKLLFNRVCYCKGTTGYYRITKGNLSVKKIKRNVYNFQIDFKIKEVPQIITTINETLILK